jgi:hypothetical protein
MGHVMQTASQCKRAEVDDPLAYLVILKSCSRNQRFSGRVAIWSVSRSITTTLGSARVLVSIPAAGHGCAAMRVIAFGMFFSPDGFISNDTASTYVWEAGLCEVHAIPVLLDKGSKPCAQAGMTCRTRFLACVCLPYCIAARAYKPTTMAHS